jgi:hypothetical protein
MHVVVHVHQCVLERRGVPGSCPCTMRDSRQGQGRAQLHRIQNTLHPTRSPKRALSHSLGGTGVASRHSWHHPCSCSTHTVCVCQHGQYNACLCLSPAALKAQPHCMYLYLQKLVVQLHGPTLTDRQPASLLLLHDHQLAAWAQTAQHCSVAGDETRILRCGFLHISVYACANDDGWTRSLHLAVCCLSSKRSSRALYMCSKFCKYREWSKLTWCLMCVRTSKQSQCLRTQYKLQAYILHMCKIQHVYTSSFQPKMVRARIKASHREASKFVWAHKATKDGHDHVLTFWETTSLLQTWRKDLLLRNCMQQKTTCKRIWGMRCGTCNCATYWQMLEKCAIPWVEAPRPPDRECFQFLGCWYSCCSVSKVPWHMIIFLAKIQQNHLGTWNMLFTVAAVTVWKNTQGQKVCVHMS